MRVRRTTDHRIAGSASTFNILGIGEMIVGFDDSYMCPVCDTELESSPEHVKSNTWRCIPCDVVYKDLEGLHNGMDSCYVREYDVFIEALDQWKTFYQAERDKDIIHDNYNTHFFEPTTQEDRERGYTL